MGSKGKLISVLRVFAFRTLLGEGIKLASRGISRVTGPQRHNRGAPNQISRVTGPQRHNRGAPNQISTVTGPNVITVVPQTKLVQ
jgi:hypothetical protein